MKQELGNLMAEDPHQETINLLNYRLKAVSTELAAVTEQLKETRKHLKDANRGAEINAHALRINADKLTAVSEQLKAAQDGWHDEITKGLSELRRAESIYTKAQERAERAEEQRDEYKAALQSADNHNHEIATKLEIATEQLDAVTLRLGDTQVRMFDAERQRDRLAEALKQIQGVGLVAVDVFDELDRIDEIVDEALQSLNQPTP